MTDLFQTADPANHSSGRVIRPHQAKAIDMVRDAFRAGCKRVVLQMATGGGKTFVASEIIKLAWRKNPHSRVVFTVPLLTLIDQTIAAFRSEGIQDIGVIQGSHALTRSGAGVQVASVQTLARREAPEADLVLVDEAHIHSEGVIRLMRANPRAHFVGLSATPWRKGMAKEWERLCIAATTADLIEAGLLADFRVFAPDDPDMSGAKIVAGDYRERDAAEAMADKQIVGNIVAKWLELGRNQPTLGFAVDCASAQAMRDRFEDAGIASGYIDAKTDAIERALIRRRFVEGDIKVIWSVRTMTTGVDMPVGCIIDAAPTCSEMLHVQKIGRALRVNPGLGDSEGRAIILDHAGNTGRNGFVTDIVYPEFVDGVRSETAERKRKERLPKPCPKCSHMVPVGLKVCPACGHERQMPPPVEMVDGELAEMQRGPKSGDSMADKQRFWSMALWLDRDRNKGGKLAKGMYKGRFGVWPRGLSDRTMPPDQAFWNYERAQRIRYAKAMAKRQEAAHV